jgi:hypothetical protein
LKKTKLGPLRQGQRLDTSETKLYSSKDRKPPNQSSKTTKSPLHTCKLPLNQCNSPWTNACKTPLETGQLEQLSPDRSDRSPSLVRPVGKIAQHLGTTPVKLMPSISQTDATWETARAQNSSNPLGNLLNACSKPFQAQTSPLC